MPGDTQSQDAVQPWSRQTNTSLKILSERCWRSLKEVRNTPGSPISLENEITRFKLWSDNIGAMKLGSKSLDHRLNAAPSVTRSLSTILNELTLAAVYLGRSVSAPEDDESENTDSGSEASFDVDSFSDTTSDSEDNPGDTEVLLTGSRTEVLLLTIRNCITDLLKLSIAIRKVSRKDVFARSKKLPQLDPTYDIEHVRNKFYTSSSRELLKRLGKSNCRRRQHFMYRQEHRRKLATEEQEQADLQLDALTAPSRTEFTKATTMLTLPPSVPVEKLVDEDDSDVGSVTTFNTVFADERDLRVPSAPAMSLEGPFECPFCYHIITIKGRDDWKRHVYRDLHPYVCTFPDCDMKLFESQHEWFEHELANHWTQTTCCFCNDRFRDRKRLESHLQENHPEAANLPMDDLVRTCTTTEAPDAFTVCPLCHDWYAEPSTATKSLHERYRKHVGRHLEQLALFTLPRLDNDDSDTDDAMTDDSASTAARASAASSQASFDPNERPDEQHVWAAGDRHLCELYRREHAEWVAKHMGYCHVQPRMGSHSLIVLAKDGGTAILFEIQVPRIHGFRMPGDTLIEWSDKEDGCDMAIKFETSGGCRAIWDAVIKVKMPQKSPADALDLDAESSVEGKSEPRRSETETAAPAHLRKIFVGNLNPETDEAALKTHFEVFGDIVDCRIVKYQDTGISKGSGYISFGSSEAARKAVDSARQFRGDITVDMAAPADHHEMLSVRARCQRCRTGNNECDRQRPCWRCSDAGIGVEGCVSEDESEGAKDETGRPLGVPVVNSKTLTRPSVEPTETDSGYQTRFRNHLTSAGYSAIQIDTLLDSEIRGPAAAYLSEPDEDTNYRLRLREHLANARYTHDQIDTIIEMEQLKPSGTRNPSEQPQPANQQFINPHVPFISKLYDMIENEMALNVYGVTRWSSTGESFFILTGKAFRKLLRTNFNHEDVELFVRQLEMCGFHKISTQEAGSDELQFKHDGGNFREIIQDHRRLQEGLPPRHEINLQDQCVACARSRYDLSPQPPVLMHNALCEHRVCRKCFDERYSNSQNVLCCWPGCHFRFDSWMFVWDNQIAPAQRRTTFQRAGEHRKFQVVTDNDATTGLLNAIAGTVLKFMEFGNNRADVDAQSRIFLELLRRLHRDTEWCIQSRFRLVELIDDQSPEQKESIDSCIRNSIEALEEIGECIEGRTYVYGSTKVRGLSLEQRFKWVLSNHDKFIDRQLRLQTCHTALSLVISTLSGLEASWSAKRYALASGGADIKTITRGSGGLVERESKSNTGGLSGMSESNATKELKEEMAQDDEDDQAQLRDVSVELRRQADTIIAAGTIKVEDKMVSEDKALQRGSDIAFRLRAARDLRASEAKDPGRSGGAVEAVTGRFKASSSSQDAEQIRHHLSPSSIIQYPTTDIVLEDLDRLAADLQGPYGIEVKDRRHNFKKYRAVFVSSELTDWLRRNVGDVVSRGQAVTLGHRLMDMGLFKHTSSQHAFREGDYWFQLEPKYQMTALAAKTRLGLTASKSGGGAAVGAAAGMGGASGIIDQEMTAKAKEMLNADNAKLKLEKAGQDNALQLI